jgi:hypothetical protein
MRIGRRQMRQRVHVERVGVQHLEAAGVGGGDLGQRGQAAGVLLDGQHAAGALGQKAARQAAGAGADFEHVAAGEVSGGAGDLGGEVEVEKEVLAKAFLGRQFMSGDDIAKGWESVDASHQERAFCVAEWGRCPRRPWATPPGYWGPANEGLAVGLRLRREVPAFAGMTGERWGLAACAGMTGGACMAGAVMGAWSGRRPCRGPCAGRR